MTTASAPTLHTIRGSRYGGAWEAAEVLSVADSGLETRGDITGYVVIRSTVSRVTQLVRSDEIFASEAEARAAAKALRAPRRPRQTQPLYGDFAWVAAFNGIRTDGSGKVAR